MGVSLLFAGSFPAGSSPFNTAGNPAELVVVLALGAAEVKDGPVLFYEHLAGARLKLDTTEGADMLFDHSLPPRHFLCFALGFKEHNDISFPDGAYRVARDDPALVIAIKDAALHLHCLTVHAG
jgi:hypothetical protein